MRSRRPITPAEALAIYKARQQDRETARRAKRRPDQPPAPAPAPSGSIQQPRNPVVETDHQ